MRHENEREVTNTSTKITYLLVGGAIGALVALLFAPKSGQELRGDIADATRRGLEKGKEAFTSVGEKAAEFYEVTKEKAGEMVGKATEAGAATTNPFAAAIEAGKEAYNEEKRKNEAKSIKEGRPSYPVENEG